MEVKEVDVSNDGHRIPTLLPIARPSSESVGPLQPPAPQQLPLPPATLPTATESSALLDSSSSMSPSETKDPSSPKQPTLVVTAPLSTPNPFALLVDDVKDDDAPNGIQRASTPISSACSSSVAIVSSADSNLVGKVDMTVPAGPIKPAETATKPNANKRPCTRASTTTTPTHGFFQRLATRPGAVRAHFEKHYLPTSRMCSCDLFPVYADKVEGVPKLPPELNAFCLHCISADVLAFGGPLVKACSIWAPGFIKEMEAHYITFYEEKEFKELKSLKRPV